mgnify:CR=1 FL=1
MRILAPLSLALVLSACAGGPPTMDIAAAVQSLDAGREAAHKGDHPAAIDHYSAALKVNPEMAEAYYERGVSNVRLRLSPPPDKDSRPYEDRALSDFSAAVRFNPAYGDAFFNRAMILSSRAMYKPAAEDLLNAIRFKPHDAEPHFLLGRLYETKFEDSMAAALEHYEKYVDLGGPDAETREKVRVWKQLKLAAAQPQAPAPAAKAPTPDDEKKAQELHEEFKRLFSGGRKVEALQAVDTLLSKHGHTQYVQQRARELNALRNALKK